MDSSCIRKYDEKKKHAFSHVLTHYCQLLEGLVLADIILSAILIINLLFKKNIMFTSIVQNDQFVLPYVGLWSTVTDKSIKSWENLSARRAS
jgi:hypothetical protein